MTYAEAQAAYQANADFDETNSVSKAKTFRTACRVILGSPSRVQKSAGASAQEAEYDLGVVAEQMKAADRWIAANDDSHVGAGASVFDFSDLRT